MRAITFHSTEPQNPPPQRGSLYVSKLGALVIIALLLGGPMLLAQLPTGAILGVVKDSSGAVVPGASIIARETDTNQSRSATTGGDGAYRFDDLPVGTYEITVEESGFTRLTRQLTLSVGQALALPLKEKLLRWRVIADGCVGSGVAERASD